MATLRADEPVEAPPPTAAAPPELLVGALAEVWAEHAHPHDLGGAHMRYGAALHAWQAAEHLTTAQMCELVNVPRSPWSLATYDADGQDADARLALAGVTRTDLPALRRAAQERTTDSRRTP